MRVSIPFVSLLACGVAWAQIQKLGYYDYFVDESSPVIYNGRLLMFESIVQDSPQWAGHWFPEWQNCSCYFRVRDQLSGSVLVNISSTCNHAFGEAFVSTNDEGLDTLFVMGTTWIRPGSNQVTGSQRLSKLHWSGPCAQQNCSVDSFYSNDPSLQSWTAVPSTVQVNYTVYNQDVAHIGPPGTRLHGLPVPAQWVMLLEVSGDAAKLPTLFISDRSDPTDAGGWTALDASVYGLDKFGNGQIGACPSIRYDPSTQFFYVLTGGISLLVLRSQNLTRGSWQLGQSMGVVLSANQGDCRQAPAPYGQWFNLSSYPDAVNDVSKCLAGSPTGPGFGADSDVDLTEYVTPNGDVVTLVQYGSGDQATFGFSNLAIAYGPLFKTLESFFD